VIEAFCHGKPVIGSNLGGIAEIIDENINGIKFEAGNYSQLTLKIKNLSSENTVKMGKNARLKAEKQYNSTLHYEKLINIYKFMTETY
ncbi:MAG: glycosyltransferase, partial [Candidatus Gastranaerophilales bacterium]|nr:glycosyltransferase [Candidatus Gastranaerophilales bacterium]